MRQSPHHAKRRPPIVWQLLKGASECAKIGGRGNDLAETVHKELDTLAALRKQKAAKDVRRWAETTSKGLGHKVLKVVDPVMPASASADKKRIGEACLQRAADAGINEWSVP